MTDYFGDDNVAGAMLPAAIRIVSAVRDDDRRALLEAIHDAEHATESPAWRLALIIALAAMVPDNRTPSQLLGWMNERPDAA